MKTELEREDIEAIVSRVVEALKLQFVAAGREEETIFDKEALARYLSVDVSWINKQITLRAIPYLKMGKYTRFKRSHIDKWLESAKIEVSPMVKMFQKRGQVG